MLAHIDTSSFNGLNIHASFCVAFAGFLRSRKLTWDKWDHAKSPTSHISRQSVKFTVDGVVIHLPKLKTEWTSHYHTPTMLLVQSVHYAASSTDIHVLLSTPYWCVP